MALEAVKGGETVAQLATRYEGQVVLGPAQLRIPGMGKQTLGTLNQHWENELKRQENWHLKEIDNRQHRLDGLQGHGDGLI